MEIAIINYGMNNLYSVQNACNNLGINSVITDDHEVILNSKIVILPGVGAYGEAIQNIKSKKLDKSIYDFISTGKPFFAVCLGMQLLFDKSSEFGSTDGLGIIKGKVSRFDSDIKKKLIVPHVGWNKVSFNNNNYKNSVMQNNLNEEFMYFVHSYYVTPSSKDIELTSTTYQDTTYCSSIVMENITAFQFHPEKSGNNGKKIFSEIKKLL